MSTTGLTSLDASFRGSRGFFADIDRDLLAGIRAWPIVDHARLERYPPALQTFCVGAVLDHDQHGRIHHPARRDLQPHFQNRAQDLSAIPCPWLHHLGLCRHDHRRELRYRFRKANASSGRSGCPTRFIVFRVVWRNFIVFLHTIVIFVPVAIIFDVRPGFTGLLALPGLALVYINQAWLTLSLADHMHALS